MGKDGRPTNEAEVCWRVTCHAKKWSYDCVDIRLLGVSMVAHLSESNHSCEGEVDNLRDRNHLHCSGVSVVLGPYSTKQI